MYIYKVKKIHIFNATFHGSNCLACTGNHEISRWHAVGPEARDTWSFWSIFQRISRWWQLKYFFIFTPKFGEDEPNLTSMFFQMGWFNHQLDLVSLQIYMEHNNGCLVQIIFLSKKWVICKVNHVNLPGCKSVWKPTGFRFFSYPGCSPCMRIIYYTYMKCEKKCVFFFEGEMYR